MKKYRFFLVPLSPTKPSIFVASIMFCVAPNSSIMILCFLLFHYDGFSSSLWIYNVFFSFEYGTFHIYSNGTSYCIESQNTSLLVFLNISTITGAHFTIKCTDVLSLEKCTYIVHTLNNLL